MADVLTILLGFFLYFVLFLPASYGVCWLARPFGFRQRSSFFRICAAQALSFAVTPYILFLLYRWATPWLILVPAGAGAVLMTATIRRLRWRHVKPALFILLLITCFALVLVTEWTVGTRTYLSTTAQDYAKHVAVTQALSADRVPPLNPSFAPGHPVPLFYYYFWFLTSRTVQVVSKGLVPARHAVTAGVIYNTLSLVAAVVISAWLLFPGPRRRNRTRLFMALGLLLVSGLDLVAFLIILIRRFVEGRLFVAGSIPGSVLWWNEQVTNWPATALWVPHHLAAFIVLWLLFWEAALELGAPVQQSWRLILFRAVALVSIFGMSVWLGLLAGLVFALWTLQRALNRDWRTVATWTVTGVLAVVLAFPYLQDLSRSKMTSASPVALSVRRFFPIEVLFNRLDPALNSVGIAGFALKLFHQAIFLLCLPVNYAIELGVLLLGAFLYWRYCRGTPYELRGGRAWWALLLPCALVATSLRSSLANNDLGWRAFLPLQMAMLLALVVVWDHFADRGVKSRWRAVLITLASVGLATTLCDLALMRIQPIVEGLATKPSPASRTFSRKQAYLRLNASDPSAFYVQHNPDRTVDFESGLFWDRKVVLADVIYGQLYGVDPKIFRATMHRIKPVFENCGAGAEEYAAGVAEEYHIRFWIFQNNDEVWKDRQCWIWSQPAFFADRQVLVIPANKQ